MGMLELRQPTDIEQLLIWTYRDQKADRVIGMGMGLYDQESALAGKQVYRTSTDGIAAIERIGILGTRVDGGGPSSGLLHTDAEYVHEAVMSLPRPECLLVMQHARAATRPDSTSIPTPKPLRQAARNGRTRIAYADWDKHRDYGWCPIDWTVEPVTIDAIELEYTLWRRILIMLALALSRDGRLTRHRAMAPSAPMTATLLFV